MVSPFAVREITQSMLSWVRGPTRLDVEGSVASSVFPVSASMSSLSDDQTAASLSVDDPVVDIQFLITAERMIVGGVTVGASLASLTLQLTEAPGDNMFDVSLGCLDTNLTRLEVPLAPSNFNTLFIGSVIAVHRQQGFLDIPLQVCTSSRRQRCAVAVACLWLVFIRTPTHAQ